MTHVYAMTLRLLKLAIFLIAGLPALASAQDAAQLTAPANGGSDVHPRVTFTWNAIPDALAYYLYVGTSPGAKDVVNTGEIQRTQHVATVLTGGTQFHARLHTKFASGWKFTELSFTTRAVPILTTPADQAANVAARPTFRWTSVTGASAYYLYVGTTPGARDVVNTGELQAVSYQPAAALPAARTLYARMHARTSGAWRFTETTFTTAAEALITSPADGAVDVDTRQPLTWTTVAGAQAYFLYVGTTPGERDLISSGETQATSRSIASLPPGQTVFARLYTKYENRWRFTEISFTTRAAAQFVSPKHGAKDVTAEQLATWTSLPNAAAYYLIAGSSPGGRDYIDTGELQATSYPLSALPRGATVYLRLSTRVGQSWKFVEATITTDARARLLAPLDGATNVPRHSLITWSSVPGADAYFLYVGTTPGAKDLINSAETSKTSWPADVLPAGQTVYARIWTKFAGRWGFVDSSFTMRAGAVLDGKLPNGAQIDTRNALTWQPVAGADRYYVYVGTTPGAKDLIDSSEITRTNQPLLGLPGGRPIYVRLYSFIGGRWLFEEYSLTTAPLAYLVAPRNAAVDVDLERLSLKWNPVDAASAYRVQLGSTPGGSDIWVSTDQTDTDVELPPIPGGRVVHVRMWARQNGVWRATDAQFTGKTMSQLIYPSANATDFDESQPFRWTTVEGAFQYSIAIGSSPGGSDLVSSGPLTGTSLSIAGLPVGQTLYVRIGARITGWRYVDSVLRLGGVNPAPLVTYPTADGELIEASTPLEWVRDPLARSYRLTIGSSPGLSDLHDSGSIRVHRRFVRDLPTGVLLYGNVSAEYAGGGSTSTPFNFLVASSAVTAADEIDGAFWATGFVRSMAATNNIPYGNTFLTDVRRSEAQLGSDCASYSLGLQAVIYEMGIVAPTRRLGVCLNTNRFDCHTLVELFDDVSARWILIDPTFGLALRRAADGSFATSADVSDAARAMDWPALEYEFVTPLGAGYATGYYLDYATMFLNVYATQGGVLVEDPPATTLPYFDYAGSSVVATPGSYALQCASGESTVRAAVNGAAVELTCSGVDRLTHIFLASNIQPLPDGGQLDVYRALRFTF